jgi:hypothetical protein
MMSDFLLSMKEYWYLWVIFAVLLIITIFVMRKAFAASKCHSGQVNEMLKQAEHDKNLFERYNNAEKTVFQNDSADDVIDGLGIVVEQKISKEDDHLVAFNNLSDVEKQAYAIRYFFKDSKEKLSDFFRNNTHPLTDNVLIVLEECSNEAFLLSKILADMTDDDNETVSFDSDIIDEKDKEYSKLDLKKIKENVKEYLLKNL